jgi:hypothetical protein
MPSSSDPDGPSELHIDPVSGLHNFKVQSQLEEAMTESLGPNPAHVITSLWLQFM